MEENTAKKESKIKKYLHRYFIDAMSAMAQGLFASLLIGTIISTLGTQLNIPVLDEIGGYAKSAAGPAMAVAIGYALEAPPLVLFSLVAVGGAANTLGGAGGRLLRADDRLRGHQLPRERLGRLLRAGHRHLDAAGAEHH